MPCQAEGRFGNHFKMESFNERNRRSMSCMTAIAVIGLVTEAISNAVSVVMGAALSAGFCDE